MKKFTIGILSLVILASFAVSPAITSARSTTPDTDLQTKINELLAQIAKLQSQVGNNTNSNLNKPEILIGPEVNNKITYPQKAGKAVIVGSKSVYEAGETIRYGVRGITTDGKVADPSSGLHVQAHMRFNDANGEVVKVKGVYQAGNAEYNYDTHVWDVTMTAPSNKSKSYVIDSSFYCSRPLDGCVDNQINEAFSFKLKGSKVETNKSKKTYDQPSSKAPAVSFMVNNSNGPTVKWESYQQLKWESKNTDYCVGSSMPEGYFHDASKLPTTGLRNVWAGYTYFGPITYKVTCGVTSGKYEPVTQTIIVTKDVDNGDTNTKPSVVLKINGEDVEETKADLWSRLTWESKGADYCVGSSDPAGFWYDGATISTNGIRNVWVGYNKHTVTYKVVCGSKDGKFEPVSDVATVIYNN